MGAGGGRVDTGAAGDIAQIAGEGDRVDELAAGAGVETVCGAICEIEAYFAFGAVKVGPLKASDAFECAVVAVHGSVAQIDEREVVVSRTVAGMVGHIGEIAVDTRVDAGAIEEVGFVSTGCVAAGADG